MMMHLDDELRRGLPTSGAFDAIMALKGQVFREHKHRRTMRCEIGGRDYFVKLHSHTGWREILKNVARGRIPTVTARPERDAIEACRLHAIPTVTCVGWGVRGSNPARMESFIITRPLDGFVHLDEVVQQLSSRSHRNQFMWMRQIATELGSLAGTFHGAGMNHRDFYLSHFMLPAPDLSAPPPSSLDLHVIDLHRVQHRSRVPMKWRAKDLAGLLFSSLDGPLTTSMAMRFLHAYSNARNLRETLRRDRHLWRSVRRRAIRVYRSDHGRSPRLPAYLSSF